MSDALGKVIGASVPIFARYTKPGDLAIISEWDTDIGVALNVVPRPDVGATAIIWLIIGERPWWVSSDRTQVVRR